VWTALSTGVYMNNTQMLLDAVRKAHPNLGQNETATLIKRTKQAVSNWRTGLRQIEDLTTVVEICIAADLPVGEWVARFGEASATTKQAASWWKNIAKVAAICLAVYTSTSPSPALSQTIHTGRDEVDTSNLTFVRQTMHCALFKRMARKLLSVGAR